MRTMIFATSFVLFCESTSFGQKVGDRIVVTTYGVHLKSDDDVVGTIPQGNILTVKEVGGDSFRVTYSEGTPTMTGWINRRDVMPVEESLEFFEDKLRRNPTASLHNIRGKIWNDKRNNNAALDDFNESIRLDATQAEPWRNRARAWCKLGEIDKALADCNEAIRLDPKDGAAYITRGIVRKKRGDCDKALADYDEAIRLDPKNALAFSNRGMSWDDKGEHNRAIADYTEAIRLDSEYATPYLSRGIAWNEKEDYGKAIADFDKAIQLAPYWSLIYFNRASACFHQGDYDRSITDFAVWLRSSPQDVDALHVLALILAACPHDKCRDGKRAVALATKACQLGDWSEPEVLDTLAAAYAEVGDFDNAVKWQQTALELTSDGNKDRYGRRLNLYKSRKPYRFETK